MKLISYEYSKVRSVCDAGSEDMIDGCDRIAHHHVILLGEDTALCSLHLEQLYAEALELCDQYQKKRGGKSDDQ